MGASSSTAHTLQEQSESSPWTIVRSASLDSEEITAFEHSPFLVPDPVLTRAAQNGHKVVEDGMAVVDPLSWTSCAQHIKALRHPSVLRFQWDQLDASGSIAVITDPVRPLSVAKQSWNDNDVALGLHSILRALDFLHNKVQFIRALTRQLQLDHFSAD